MPPRYAPNCHVSQAPSKKQCQQNCNRAGQLCQTFHSGDPDPKTAYDLARCRALAKQCHNGCK